jgi:hypothetical protein
MARHTLTRAGVLGVTLSLLTAAAWTAPRNQQQSPPAKPAETSVFQAADREQDTALKIKLLDDFVAQYPDSSLLPRAYRDYYLAYFSLRKYAQSIEYADDLLALGANVDFGMRLEALLARESAYSIGCGDPAFQTPDAFTKARDAAALGLEMLARWQKPEALADDQFAAEKASLRIVFAQVGDLAKEGLANGQVACSAPPPADPGNFEHMINDIKAEDRPKQ